MKLCIRLALFGVGQALLAIIGYYVPYWRYVSIILCRGSILYFRIETLLELLRPRLIAIPTIIGFFIPCFMDESARWLISMKRIEQAEQVLNKIATTNNQQFRGLQYWDTNCII